jgi:hypothetical protein
MSGTWEIITVKLALFARKVKRKHCAEYAALDLWFMEKPLFDIYDLCAKSGDT